MNILKNLVISLLIFLISCNNIQEEEEDNFENFDIINLKDGIEKSIRYTKTTNYVCLDTTKKALFAYIDKLIIKDNKIYILDTRAKQKVLCFNFEGDHIRNYGRLGKGPGEYTKPFDFDIGDNGDVYIFSNKSKKIYQYNSNGRFINAYQQDFYAKGFKLLSDGSFFFILDNRYETKKNSMICIHNPNSKDNDYLFHYNKNDKTNVKIFNYTQSYKSGFICYIPRRDYFFVFNNGGKFIKGYRFNFGSETLPNKYKFDALNLNNYEGDYKYLTTSPIIIDNKIIGEIMTKNKHGKEKTIFIFNKTNHKLLLDKIQIDNYSHKSLYPYLCTHDNKIISLLNYETFNLSINKDAIPKNITDHIKNGGYVLTINRL